VTFHKPSLRPLIGVVLPMVGMFLALTYLRSPKALEKHHIAAGLALAGLICLGFGITGIASGVVSALRPGGGLPATLPVARDNDPIRFWINVSLYVGLSIAFFMWARGTIVR
jgi:hypothetical protein